VGENLLTRLRDGQLALNPEITTALLGTVDAVRQILTSIASTGQEGERDYSKLIAELTRLQQPPEAKAETNAKIEAALAPVRSAAPGTLDSSTSLGDILMQQAGVTAPEINRALEKQQAGDPRHLGEILVEQQVVQATDVVKALNFQQAARASSVASDSTIRADVGLLDKLMNLVGELVLARNQVLQFTSRVKDSSFHAASQRLNLITVAANIREHVQCIETTPSIPAVFLPLLELLNAPAEEVKLDEVVKLVSYDNTMMMGNHLDDVVSQVPFFRQDASSLAVGEPPS
jgi:two-component system chemotaxis sensor kinase CheA